MRFLCSSLLIVSPPYNCLEHLIYAEQTLLDSLLCDRSFQTPRAFFKTSFRFSNMAALNPRLAIDDDFPAVAEIQPISINAWTEEVSQTVLNSLAVSTGNPTAVRGTRVSIAIPLDVAAGTSSHGARHASGTPVTGTPSRQIRHASSAEDEDAPPSATPRRKLVRRDSLERREALLKGKEGTRRRQRWENGWCSPQHSIDAA